MEGSCNLQAPRSELKLIHKIQQYLGRRSNTTWNKWRICKTNFLDNIQKLCSSYREICVTNRVMKIFGKIFIIRLEEQYKGIEEQIGFSADWSCIDYIFGLRQILDKQRDKGKATLYLWIVKKLMILYRKVAKYLNQKI